MTAIGVERVGPALLVEDFGRRGWGHVGVPPSGAVDQSALALANRLVGNPEGAAGLEVLLGECLLVARRSVRIALVGAEIPMRIDNRSVAWGQPISVRAGQAIELGRATRGLRGWLAVAGGVDVPAVLGSRSTDTFSGLGPEPVRVGQVLEVGPAPREAVSADVVPVPDLEGPWRVRVAPGPRDDWFVEGAVETLLGTEYVVSSASDRVAIRLDSTAGTALRRRDRDELQSEGLVTGAVQVPASGMPLIFLTDHPVTGGYPVIGVIDRRGLALCAQARPGDRLGFRL